jgi:hypothetical protein
MLCGKAMEIYDRQINNTLHSYVSNNLNALCIGKPKLDDSVNGMNRELQGKLGDCMQIKEKPAFPGDGKLQQGSRINQCS